MPPSALASTTARYEGAGYVATQNRLRFSHARCKSRSHDSADLAIGHLEIETGFRHRHRRRRSILNLACDRAASNGLRCGYGRLFICCMGHAQGIMEMAHHRGPDEESRGGAGGAPPRPVQTKPRFNPGRPVPGTNKRRQRAAALSNCLALALALWCSVPPPPAVGYAVVPDPRTLLYNLHGPAG
jgi:hypothetical protein